MEIKIDDKEIISFSEFELGWRFELNKNQEIPENVLTEIFPLSVEESKRLYKIINHYEYSIKNAPNTKESNWFRASCEDDVKIKNFQNILNNYLIEYEEDVLIKWHRKISLKTSKKNFIEYWTDFLYPSSDDATIISTKCNWVLNYSHYEVANLWIKNKNERTT